MERRRFEMPHKWWLPPGLLVLASLTACVYFNTFYNAEKYFGQAEKARRDEEDVAILEQRAKDAHLSARTEQLYEKAAKKASRVLEKYPESGRVDDALFLLGRAFYWQQDYLSAARSFRELEEGFPQSDLYDRARYWRALSLEGQGEYDSARALYRDLLDGAGPDVGARAGLRLGEMAFAQDEHVVAVQQYRAALENYPGSDLEARLWLGLGEALMAMEDSTRHEEALQAFSRVLEADPSAEVEYLARLNRGRLFYARGQLSQALPVYRGLLDEGRFRAFEGRTRILIGRHYQKEHNLGAALEEYEQVRDDFPQSESSAMALYQTGLLYLREYGEEESAKEYFTEVGREKPGSKAAVLARDMLRYLGEIAAVRQRITRADSLAAVQGGEVTSSAGRDSMVNGSSIGAGARATAGDVPETAETGVTAAAPDTAVPALPGTVAAALPTGTLSRPDTVLPTSTSPPATGAAADTLQQPAGKGPLDADSTRSPAVAAAQAGRVLDDLLQAAELYRDPERLGVPDSAVHYLQEIRRRFPEFEEMPRILYSLAWTYSELKDDPEAGRSLLEELIELYPESGHANAARRELGRAVRITAAQDAKAEFQRLEKIRLRDPRDLRAYVPLLDSLSRKYPGTDTGAKAAYVAAHATENIAGDSAAAAARYADIRARFPRSRYADLVAARDSVQRAGLVSKLQRGLKSVGGSLPVGERITVLSAEPDTMDSVAWARKHHALGLRAYRREDLQQARYQLERSLEERREQPEVLYQLGKVLAEQGYEGDAGQRFQEALALEPNMLAAQYSLLAAHTRAGRSDSANHYLRTIMQRDTRNPQVQLLREQYPDLAEGRNSEELELRTLEELALDPPDDDMELSSSTVLREPPLVRRPTLPAAVQGASDTAEVIVDILVDTTGGVGGLEVYSGPDSLHGPAIMAAEQYTFFPAVDRRGRKVPVWVELVLPFVPATPGATKGVPGPVWRPPDADGAGAGADTRSAGGDAMHERPASEGQGSPNTGARTAPISGEQENPAPLVPQAAAESASVEKEH